MQREAVVRMLKERGLRITRQRMVLLDIILQEDCSSCKEIYYKASRLDPKIGSATVYRMVNTLEEIGAISRKNMYRITDGAAGGELACTVELKDGTSLPLSEQNWNHVMEAGLAACGYGKNPQIRTVRINPA